MPRIPLPPDVVRIATLDPGIDILAEKMLPASKRCSTSSTRTAPAATIAASITRSSVASAPVCEAAACAPAADLPLFKIAVGLVAQTFCNRVKSENDSM